jgi:hypothetical protein
VFLPKKAFFGHFWQKGAKKGVFGKKGQKRAKKGIFAEISQKRVFLGQNRQTEHALKMTSLI